MKNEHVERDADEQPALRKSKRRRKKNARGRGMLFKRGRIYWYQFHVRGKRHRDSTGTSNERIAARLLNKLIHDAQTGSWSARRLTRRPSRI
jgi:hypothetical protein